MSPTQEFESLQGSTVYLTSKTYLIFNYVGVFRIKLGTNSKVSELKRLARVTRKEYCVLCKCDLYEERLSYV